MIHKTRRSIRQILIMIGLGALMISGGLALQAHTASAAIDPLAEACKGSSSSPICKERAEKKGIGDIITRVVNIMLFILGSIAVIMIIFSGFRFVTSAGDPAVTKSARNTILFAVVGLVVAIFAYAIVNFVITQFGKDSKSSGSKRADRQIELAARRY